MVLFIKVLSIIVGIFIPWLWSKEFARKPSKRMWRRLQYKTLVRYTDTNTNNEDGSVQITVTQNPIGNASSGFRPTIHFFVGKPNFFQLLTNRINSFEKKVEIQIYLLDKTKLRYRPIDKVITYHTNYIGPGTVSTGDVSQNLIKWTKYLRKPYAAAYLVTTLLLSWFSTTIILGYIVHLPVLLSAWLGFVPDSGWGVISGYSLVKIAIYKHKRSKEVA